MRHKVAIVVLNYLNYKDTIECVDSIIRNHYIIEGIVIVDNGSSNDSFQHLKSYYQDKSKVVVINTESNLGYAKGNNAGIALARKLWKIDCVLVVNNDTIFTDPNYINKLLCKVKDNVGIVDSNVICRNGKLFRRIRNGTTIPELLAQYLNLWMLHRDICKEDSVFARLGRLHMYTFPQGSALMFTQYYFKHYAGFFPRTFLYREEQILFLLLKKAGLRVSHVSTASIFHKEDMSSKKSFNNEFRKKLEYELNSMRYVLLVKLLSYSALRRIIDDKE